VRSRSCAGFRTFGLIPRRCDDFGTHGHADHFGGASYSGTFRLEGLRVGSGLERDGESPARAVGAAGRVAGRPETRRRNQVASRSSATSESHRYRAGPHARSWDSSSPEGSGTPHTAALFRGVADAANLSDEACRPS
jgi:hypothetical protein